MTDSVVKARLGTKAEVVVPKPVRDALGLKPGDEFAFVIEGDQVRVVSVSSQIDDPFAGFTEWASAADTKGYAEF
ncbi:MAG TPA: AbrB/MazE/SpoVT family DNA-binding domain-containing protein [Stellaceae bacterium]|nr:AbrB/MazE/SpoVT family DNA-binding domain-containing protein [Stellaceae bacterium]